MREAIELDGRARLLPALERAEDFFMARGRVKQAVLALARTLDEANIPYMLVGAMALASWGYERVTDDVDVLLTREGLESLKRRWLGRGYLERLPGSRGLRDAVHSVDVDVVLTGDYPGDGKPKDIAFPDPSIAELREGVRVAPLPTLIELKLASGMSAPHRLKDLADVLELIRVAALSRELVDRLHPSVRAKYLELWEAGQTRDPV